MRKSRQLVVVFESTRSQLRWRLRENSSLLQIAGVTELNNRFRFFVFIIVYKAPES